MVVVYPVIFTPTMDEKDTYLIEIPDLKGFTEGYGLADAIRMARDYIGNYCYPLADEEVPKSSALEDVDVLKGEFAETGKGFASLVDLDVDAFRRKANNKAIRRNVSIPGWLNQAAEREHINVSRVLQEALMEKLNV